MAVATGPEGVLAGRRRDGAPPWVFPGGSIEAGESAAGAAVRECSEETGVLVTVRSEIGHRVHPATGRLIIYMACVAVGVTAPRVTAPRELVEVRWLAVHEVAELMPDLYGPVRDHLVRLVAGR